jgi:cell division protein FtsL
MAVNTYRTPSKTSSTGNGGSLFSFIERFLHIDGSINEVIHVRFLPQILFVSFLSVVYIGNRHNAEKKIREINRLEVKVNDLRADYTTLMADYMFASKQSEVARKASRLGLKESSVPPKKVIIKQ